MSQQEWIKFLDLGDRAQDKIILADPDQQFSWWVKRHGLGYQVYCPTPQEIMKPGWIPVRFEEDSLSL